MLTVVLAGALIALSAIDVRTHRLPDWLTLPLIGVGLAVTYLDAPASLSLHVLAAVAGFLASWLVAELYRRRRGIDGLGLGDAKLLAAAGAWLGPLHLAPTVLLSALLALSAVLILRLLGQQVSWQSRLPFGPFLSAAFFAFWCFKLLGWSPFS